MWEAIRKAVWRPSTRGMLRRQRKGCEPSQTGLKTLNDAVISEKEISLLSVTGSMWRRFRIGRGARSSAWTGFPAPGIGAASSSDVNTTTGGLSNAVPRYQPNSSTASTVCLYSHILSIELMCIQSASAFPSQAQGKKRHEVPDSNDDEDESSDSAMIDASRATEDIDDMQPLSGDVAHGTEDSVAHDGGDTEDRDHQPSSSRRPMLTVVKGKGKGKKTLIEDVKSSRRQSTLDAWTKATEVDGPDAAKKTSIAVGNVNVGRANPNDMGTLGREDRRRSRRSSTRNVPRGKYKILPIPVREYYCITCA